MSIIDCAKYNQVIENAEPVKIIGKILQCVGLVIEAQITGVKNGELCSIFLEGENSRELFAEVVGFKGENVLLMPLGQTTGISPGCKIVPSGHPLRVGVGYNLLGRVLNALGHPMDGLGAIVTDEFFPFDRDPPESTKRPRIKKVLATSIKAIDGLLTLGQGQRIGIFAGSGVGKSTLMGMLARGTEADINVIALIGERGREVRDFIEQSLGEEGLKNISNSVSRLMSEIALPEHKAAGGKLREVMARYNEAEDLINIGAYVKGSNPKIDDAIEKIDAVNEFLKQNTDEKYDYDEIVAKLENIFA